MNFVQKVTSDGGAPTRGLALSPQVAGCTQERFRVSYL